MKAILLCLLSSFFLLPSVAQENQKDSLATEISSLEKLKSQVASKVDALSEQLTELFSLQQSIKAKIQELDEELQQSKNERARLQAKKELTSREKKTLEAFQKIKADKEKLTKSIAQHDQRFNKQLAVLDETIGIRNELEEKIQQLKTQYETR